MNIKNHQTLLRVFAFLFVIAISILVFSIRDQATQLIRYGLPGIFLFSLLANATVLLPAPGVFLVFAMGAVLPPVWVGIAAGLGAAVGELFGYLAGFSGQAIVEHIKHYNTIVNWMRNHKITRNFLIFILALIPNPFFDLAGIAAGSLKIPISQFFAYCAIGEILKMTAIAYTGASSLQWFFPY